MSLNAKTTSLVTLVNVLIIAAVVAVIVVTKNPLALFGLFFLQNLPLFQDGVSAAQLRQMGALEEVDENDEDDTPTAPGDDYNGTTAGFTGNLKS